MVLVSYSGKEINAKIVFYGPGLCGKTTNLEYIYGSIPSQHRGKMVSMKTKTERTLFFDFLPLNLGELAGFKTRFLLYTVPGQVYYNATRKLVLKGVDAVIFVADSQRGKMDENIESFQNLKDNLQEHGLSLGNIPYVLQYNKRDLPDTYSVSELETTLNKESVPSFEAIATTGVGVFETFKAVSKLLLARLSSEIGASVVGGDAGDLTGAGLPPDPAPAQAGPAAATEPSPAPAEREHAPPPEAAAEPAPSSFEVGRDPWAAAAAQAPAAPPEPPAPREPVTAEDAAPAGALPDEVAQDAHAQAHAPQAAPSSPDEEDPGERSRGLWRLFRKDSPPETPPEVQPDDLEQPVAQRAVEEAQPPGEVAPEARPQAPSPAPLPAAAPEAEAGDADAQKPHEIMVPVLIPRSVLEKRMVIRLDVRIVQEADTPQANSSDERLTGGSNEDLAASA
jgi:signal recognition particle receptor subunit beta